MVPRAAIKEKHINPQIVNKTNIFTKYKYQDIFPTGDEWVKTVVTYLRRLTVYDPGERTVSV